MNIDTEFRPDFPSPESPASFFPSTIEAGAAHSVSALKELTAVRELLEAGKLDSRVSQETYTDLYEILGALTDSKEELIRIIEATTVDKVN